jgi:demethylmenaquinone methyltransferase / 2-methoxy-6-polyprenyl-1,4-benzoquinol methylase
MNDAALPSLVSAIFHGTARSYEDIVAAATRGADRQWKEALLGHLDAPGRVLDLACGTGILSFMIRNRFPESEVVGVDISAAHLGIAIELAHLRRDHHVRFVLGSAESIAPAERFDAVTSCYLPKYANLPRLVPRIARSLNPGGIVVMQDFTYPEHPVIQKAWERHFSQLQALARTEWPEAIRMFDLLPDVIRSSAWVEELAMSLAANGFEDIHVERLTWGTSALVLGRLSWR